MIEKAHKDEPITLKVMTPEGEKELSLRIGPEAAIKLAQSPKTVAASCGCMCTPERSASLLTTVK